MATTDAIIISPKVSDHSFLLEQLNYNGFELNRTSEENGNFSMFKGSILIVENKMAVLVFADVAGLHFCYSDPTKIELLISNQYKNHKILAFLNQTTSNSYLFNYIENGERVRVKSGGSSSGITVNIGDELREETSDFQKLETENGIKYVKDGIEYSHDAVGAFQGELIAERLLGYPYGQIWSDSNIKIFEYVLSKGEDKIFVPKIISFNRFKGLTDHLFGQPYYNDRLDTQMAKVLLPIFKSHGYIYSNRDKFLTKKLSNISQQIILETNNSKGMHMCRLTFYSIFYNKKLADQLVNHFGSKYWNPVNPKLEINDQFVLQTNVADTRTFESNIPLIPFDYNKLGVVLKAYIENSLLPLSQFYFDEIKFYNGIANPLLSIAALILNNYDELGFIKIKEQLKRINYPNHTERNDYQVKMFENLLKNRSDIISLDEIAKMSEKDLKEYSFKFGDESIILDFDTDKNDSDPLGQPTSNDNERPKTISIKKDHWFLKLIKTIKNKTR